KSQGEGLELGGAVGVLRLVGQRRLLIAEAQLVSARRISVIGDRDVAQGEVIERLRVGAASDALKPHRPDRGAVGEVGEKASQAGRRKRDRQRRERPPSPPPPTPPP